MEASILKRLLKSDTLGGLNSSPLQTVSVRASPSGECEEGQRSTYAR